MAQVSLLGSQARVRYQKCNDLSLKSLISVVVDDLL